MPRLDEMAAVVTGAASGIGRATATLLAERGVSVVVADINEHGAIEVAKDLQERGLAAVPVGVDVADEDRVRHMVDTCVREFGRLDVIHNNAVMAPPEVIAADQLIEHLDADLFRRCLRVNLVGYMLGAKHAIPHMLRQGGGVVVNTSSATGLLADNLYAIYGSSKAAIYGWTRNVATQYGKQGIRAVGLSPGLVVTKMVREAAPHVIEGLMPHTLSARAGTPEDIANLVAFLISDEAAFITGVTISIDGGFTCHLPSYADHLRAGLVEGASRA